MKEFWRGTNPPTVRIHKALQWTPCTDTGRETFISIERWKAKGLIVVLFKPSVALQKFCKHTLSATERDVLKSPNM